MSNKNGSETKVAKQRAGLIVELDAAKGRLTKAEARLRELETGQPTAFVEIRQAKNIISAAKAIVQLYKNRVDEFDRQPEAPSPSPQGGKVGV